MDLGVPKHAFPNTWVTVYQSTQLEVSGANKSTPLLMVSTNQWMKKMIFGQVSGTLGKVLC